MLRTTRSFPVARLQWGLALSVVFGPLACEDPDPSQDDDSGAQDPDDGDAESTQSEAEGSASDDDAGTEGGGNCELPPGTPTDVECNDCSVAAMGKLEISMFGHDYVATGIPAADMSDGWSVTFDSFLVHVSAMTAKRYRCTIEYLEDPNGYVVELAGGVAAPGVVLTKENVGTGRYNNVGFTIGPASPNDRAKGASDENLALMTDNGYAMYIAGTATKAGVSKTFGWGLRSSRPYAGCIANANVSEVETGQAMISIHAEHLFYVSSSPDNGFAFTGIAGADVDDDGVITEAELRAAPIEGSGIDVGNKKIEFIWGWLENQSSSLGHLDDIVHCGKTEEHAEFD